MNLKYIYSDTLFHFYSYIFNFTFISCPVQYRFYFIPSHKTITYLTFLPVCLPGVSLALFILFYFI